MALGDMNGDELIQEAILESKITREEMRDKKAPEMKKVSCMSRHGCCWGWNSASKFQNELV
jgi:hypothetical protein